VADYWNIHTKIWKDPKVQTISPEAKLVFIYLLTNENRTLSGIYPITIKTIAMETDYTKEQVEAALSELESREMVFYDNKNFVVWVVNALRYVILNAKTKANVAKNLYAVRKSTLVKRFLDYYHNLDIPYEYPIDTPSIPHTYPPGDIETENETEKEKEKEKENEIETETESDSGRRRKQQAGEHEPQDATETERQALKTLKAVENYPFDYKKDLELIRLLAVDYPQLDVLDQVKRWATYKLDKPLKKKSNPRSQLRNWFNKAVEFMRRDGRQVEAKRDPPKRELTDDERKMLELEKRARAVGWGGFKDG